MNEKHFIKCLLEEQLIYEDDLNLVPSENSLSYCSRIPYMLDINGKYFFNDSLEESNWHFAGAEEYAWAEKVVLDELSSQLDSEYCDIRSLSGLNAMTIVLASFAQYTKVAILKEECGGHYATESIAKNYFDEVLFIPSSGIEIDYESLEYFIKENNIHFFYLDQCNGLVFHDVSKVSEICHKIFPDFHLHVDVSHWLGLILGRVLKNPLLEGADTLSSSTHKTFPGPQKGIFVTNSLTYFLKFKSTRFYMVSNHHFSSVLSLGCSLLEFKEWGNSYAVQTIKNANYFAKCLEERGFKVGRVSANVYTRTHQVWLFTEDDYALCREIKKYGINLNFQDYLPGSPNGGIRFGTNEFTKKGATELSMSILADLIFAVVNRSQKKHIDLLKGKLLKSLKKNKYTTVVNEIIESETRQMFKRVINRINNR